MKLILTVALVAAVSFLSSAQIVPKSRVIGLSLGAKSFYFPNGATNYSSTSFNFQPSFGKFLNEKWLFSIGPDYYYSTLASAQMNSSSRLNVHTVGLTAGITRFVPMFDKLYFTVGGSLYSRLSFSKTESIAFNGTISTTRDETANSGLMVSPGFAYYLNQRWMLTAGFGYLNYDLAFNGNGDAVHNLNFNLSTNSLAFGFKYVIGPKK